MDPIADMLIRIKNAAGARKPFVEFSYSKIKFSIAKLLESRGFIEEVTRRGRKTRKIIRTKIVYTSEGMPKLLYVRRISKPSRRMYATVKDLRYRSKFGSRVLSTSQGILFDRDARQNQVGGEVLFEIR